MRSTLLLVATVQLVADDDFISLHRNSSNAEFGVSRTLSVSVGLLSFYLDDKFCKLIPFNLNRNFRTTFGVSHFLQLTFIFFMVKTLSF